MRSAIASILALIALAPQRTAEPAKTFANPLNLPYRFAADNPSRREAADPAIVVFKGRYYLFASKSGGYWASADLLDWEFVTPTGLPIEAYAPAALALGDTLYFMANGTGIYATGDPMRGHWQFVSQPVNVGDPALFADDDGRVFVYYGLSLNGGIYGQQLDPAHEFRKIGEPFECLRADITRRGWERTGDRNLGATVDGVTRETPWVEGSWMTKHGRTYYLQYAAPGTEFVTYSDGLFTAPAPTGPFTYALNSPVSHKPSGFITGAGHSGTFADLQGRYWHISTMVVSVTHMFERRLGLFPADFDADGTFHVNTVLGDYPQVAPSRRNGASVDTFAGLMLLSYRKPARASSSAPNHPPAFANDEDVKTTWSAAKSEPGEWFQLDFGAVNRVDAVQINFGEEGSTEIGDPGEWTRQPGYAPPAPTLTPDRLCHSYLLEGSTDGKSWNALADRHACTRDVPHDYVELASPASVRYVKVTAAHVSGGGPFSLRDLRVFGKAPGDPPAAPSQVEVQRGTDRRNAVIRWGRVARADGYIVRFGRTPETLYDNVQVYGDIEVSVHSLNVDTGYAFTVDAFSGAGWTRGTETVAAR